MRVLTSTILIVIAVAAIANAEEPSPAMVVLKENCAKCHGAAKQSGKLDTRSVASLTEGGKSGPAIIPGDAENSRLVQLLQPGAKPHMPPGKKQLSDEQIRTIADWIDALETSTPPTSEETMPIAPRLPPRNMDPTSVIDFLIQSRLAERGLSPTAPTTDAEFARRIYLDLTARIPTPSQLKAFLNATDSRKRENLIDRLMASDDYAEQMALAFDVILMGRNERRLDGRRTKGWHAYLRTAFRENRPWDVVAREVLLARGDSPDRGHIWYLHERNNNHQAIAESVSRGFFGVDIACAQCHDHPLAGEIKQAHYWGLVSFFNRSKNENAKNGLAVAESAIGGFGEFANALEGTTEQASLLFLQRDEVPEDRPENPDKQEDKDELYTLVDNEPRVPKFSRREAFVDAILADHPLLARSMVNRIWALLMGRGIVHPVDKMDSEHPPSHPELLDWLARDFQEHNYDVKRLVAAIARSQAYQRSTGLPEGAVASDFASGLEKPLSAEAFLRSIEVVLLADAPDDSVGKSFRKLFPDVLAEHNLTTLRQSMMLTNHQELQELFQAASRQFEPSSRLVQGVQQLFQRVYHREPTDDELFAISDYLRERQDRPQEAIAQILWAMVFSAEFRFNH